MEDRYLFKAKRADNGEWVSGGIVRYGFTNQEKWYIVPAYASNLYSFLIDKNTICQCTGLKDKNGKLIWENDFLKYELGGVRIDFVKISSPIFSQTMRLNLQNYEIIGNIFDNPELLESEE